MGRAGSVGGGGGVGRAKAPSLPTTTAAEQLSQKAVPLATFAQKP
jgi:hypothetical protein